MRNERRSLLLTFYEAGSLWLYLHGMVKLQWLGAEFAQISSAFRYLAILYKAPLLRINNAPSATAGEAVIASPS